MAAIPVRPYLTAYEMAGGGRLDAEKTEASTRVLNNQAVESQLAAEGKRAELDSYYKKQKAFDAADQLAQEMFMNSQKNAGQPPASSSVQPNAQPAQTVAPIQPVQAAQSAQPGAVEPQQEVAQASPVAAQPTNNMRPLDQAPEPAPQQVEIVGKRMTPEQKAAYDAANPPTPVVAQPAPAPQQPVPAPAPIAAPAAPQAVVDEVRSTPVVNGRINPLSDAVVDARIKAWQTLAEQGKVPMSIASEQINTIQAGRNAQLKANLDLRKQVQEIQASDLSAAEKKLQIAATIRENEDNKAYDIYKILQQDPAAARQYAKDYGYGDFDPTNPKDLQRLQLAAVRSNAYRTEQTEARAAEKHAAEQALGSTTGLPAGYSRRVENGQVVTRDTSGNVVSQQGVDAAEQALRKASATQVNVDTKGQGKLFEKLGEGDAERVGQYQASAQAARGIYDRMGEIRTLVTDPKTGQPRTDLPLGTAQGLSVLAQRLGLKPEEVGPRMAAEAVKMNSAEAELVAGGRMKGQGAITDSERATLRKAAAGDVANFTAADWVEYTKAQQKLQAATIAAANDKVDNVIRRNPEASEKLSTFRTEVPTAHLPRGMVSTSNGSPPIIKSQAAYDALPSGAIFYDETGKRGRKP